MPEDLNIERHTIKLIKKALKRCNGSKEKAAEALGISIKTVYNKVKQYDFET